MPGATSTSSNNEIRLGDGRVLGHGEWGAREGPLVLGFHGGGLSRLAHHGDEAPSRAGLRLVLPDRPGFGLSDPCPDGSLLDWARDVGELATLLGAERFAVFGASAGGPGALACGCLLPERVAAVGAAEGRHSTRFPDAAQSTSRMIWASTVRLRTHERGCCGSQRSG